MAIIIIIMIGIIIIIMRQRDGCGHDSSGEGGATDRNARTGDKSVCTNVPQLV